MRDFQGLVGTETVRFSHGEFRLVVQPLDDAVGDLAFGSEPIEDQRSMGTDHPRHGLQSGHDDLGGQRAVSFMRRLIKDTQRKLFLILDSLNVHEAKVVNAWLAQHADRIVVFYLPPYSPELDPSEYFNGDLRGEIQRGIPAKDIVELKRTVLGHSRRIQKPPARARAYFRNKHICYAA
jgi:hypothetical protein